MNLEEIVNIPSREEYLDKYNYLFTSISPVQTQFYQLNKSIDYAYTTDEYGTEYYALFDKSIIVAILVVEMTRLNKPQIEYIQTDKKYRGQGLLRYLLNMALQNHNVIYGDTHETPETKHFWKMIIKYPQPNYKIYIYDLETNSYESTINYRADSDKDVWNDYENPIIAVIKNNQTLSNVKIQEHQEKRKKWGRDDFSIWYGDYSRGLGYENP